MSHNFYSIFLPDDAREFTRKSIRMFWITFESYHVTIRVVKYISVT